MIELFGRINSPGDNLRHMFGSRFQFEEILYTLFVEELLNNNIVHCIENWMKPTNSSTWTAFSTHTKPTMQLLKVYCEVAHAHCQIPLNYRIKQRETSCSEH